jgi:peptidoglycan-N-acetylglucosamine deacetylase
MPRVFDALLAKGFKFVTVSELLAMDKGGARPEVVKTPQARLNPQGHFVPPTATVPEVQPAQSPGTATSPR